MMTVSSLKNFEDKKLFRSCDIFDDIQRSKHVREPFSEYEILDLQDKFLNNGLHYITVCNLDFGRSLINRFLRSLNCYHNNAILTISNPVGDGSTTDLYYELLQGGYINSSTNKDFDEFFIDQFYYDFMWIEACHELVDQSWFSDFFSKMASYKIDQHIPVLVISYCK